jgi:hypothetical protein
VFEDSMNLGNPLHGDVLMSNLFPCFQVRVVKVYWSWTKMIHVQT